MRYFLRVLLLAVGLVLPAKAYPPVPPHEIYGLVRDALGNPLSGSALVVLDGPNGTQFQAPLGGWEEPNVNFRLFVPMEAGLADAPNAPSALRPEAPFQLRVRIGKLWYLPMETKGDLSTLGRSGTRTRIDLTLGVDADGNGLPDAWEQAVARYLGQKWSSGSILPGDPYGNTGLTFREVYLAGTYTMNSKDGFALEIRGEPGQSPTLAFTGVKGRTYVVQAAVTPGEWSRVPFRVRTPSGASATATEPVEYWKASDTRRVEIEAPMLPDAPMRIYRLMVE